MFGRWFGRRRPELPRELDPRLRSLAAPAVHLTHSQAPSRSYFGGQPGVRPGFSWPTAADGRPLSFIACIALDHLHTELAIDWLPDSGQLWFFYDLETMPWGFDPKDRGHWRVLHIPDIGTPIESAPPDASTKTSDGPCCLPVSPIEFHRIESLPSADNAAVDALGLPDSTLDALAQEMQATFGDRPHHQIAGHPDPVQNDNMALECQLASGGIDCGDAKGYRSAAGRTLASGASEWRLLLQIDSDGTLDVMWGDCGMLYVWVREDQARNHDFSDAWFVLQCH